MVVVFLLSYVQVHRGHNSFFVLFTSPMTGRLTPLQSLKINYYNQMMFYEFLTYFLITHLLGRTLAMYNLLYISVPFTIVQTHLQRASS